MGRPKILVTGATGKTGRAVVAQLREAGRTFGNGSRALLDFLRTPMSPGHDLDRFERAQSHPVPPVRERLDAGEFA